MNTNTETLTKFGSVWTASGGQGTFAQRGEYKLDWLKRLGGMCYLGSTFVAKTVTAYPNQGNTPLQKDGFRPKDAWPKSIWMTPRSWLGAYMLNCYGLSQDGIQSMLEKGHWQKRTEPFMISFMPVKSTREERLAEVKFFVREMLVSLPDFYLLHENVGLQLNLSCPNTGHDLASFQSEVRSWLNEIERLLMPTFIKVNALFPIELAKDLATHPACTGIVMGNAIPFGAKMLDGWPQVPWMKLFGTDIPTQSPLALKFEGKASCAGGLSGAPLLPIVCHWIREARKAGITCHINAGGGIMGPRDVINVCRAGANSISLGTINTLRPWRMAGTIALARELF